MSKKIELLKANKELSNAIYHYYEACAINKPIFYDEEVEERLNIITEKTKQDIEKMLKKLLTSNK